MLCHINPRNCTNGESGDPRRQPCPCPDAPCLFRETGVRAGSGCARFAAADLLERRSARDGVVGTLPRPLPRDDDLRSEEHTSELQSLMRISYAVFCLKKKKKELEEITTETQNKITDI